MLVPAMQWTGSKAPGWLRYDKKVLRFYAYFTEAVEHSPVEQSRIRRCQIRWGREWEGNVTAQAFGLQPNTTAAHNAHPTAR